MGDTQMPRLDPVRDAAKLTSFDLANIKEMESKNLERAKKIMKMRKSNFITAGLLVCGVMGIYGYTLYAVKQETFLDDFDEPEKIRE